MAPIVIRHAAITNRLNELFILALAHSATVVVGGPVKLSDFSEPQPDLRRLAPQRGVDSSLAYDQSVKLDLYARHGVAEYWVVDVEGKRIVTYRDPVATGYLRQTELTGSATVAPRAFPDVKLTVGDLFR